MRKLIVVVLTVVVIYSDCAKFGDDNSYTCHCINDEQCDKETGLCDRGCADGWSGASCQKQNVALGKPTSQVDTNGNRVSDLAVDGDRTTNIPDKCSDTGRNDSTRWWRVDLEEEYPINNITIYYQSEPNWALSSLPGFSIHVSKENKVPELCYTDDKLSTSAVRNVECNQVITGSYVNISNYHTREDSRFLVFCEVEISVCSVGTYGSDCTNFCHCLNNKRCSETGQCPDGCADGWTGPTCSKTCNNGTYGTGCIKPCSDRNCLVETSLCNHINGSCQGGCKEGFSGIDCLRCKDGIYGAGCSKKCSDRKCKDSNLQCDSKTGECIDGCQPGYQSIDCTQECDNGTYGQDCQFNCSSRFCQSQDKDTCSNIDGACYCLDGYLGTDCTLISRVDNPAAVVSGCVALIIIVVIVVLIIWKRRTPPPVDGEKPDWDGSRNMDVVKSEVHGPIYENSDVIRQGLAVKLLQNSCQNETCTPLEALQPPVAAQESDSPPDFEAVPTTETTSMSAEVEISPYTMPEKSDLNLAELEEFVVKTRPNDGFDLLYKGLPDNFTSSYKISQIPENHKKNRFKGYYPYDATRVVLDKLADDPHSDYINANFLKGYDGKKFIAAQGPTRITQNDFVRMIWDLKCDKVVMVTSEFEGGRKKCERYWPKVGSETFGEIKLTLKEEICRENYTKRHIIMERDGMTHTFYHFHYISWPDHGVPEVNDMLDFQFTVNKFTPESTRPVLVHCSAGVGRTGTYIAIDYCLKQYNDIGKVDVLECVKTLRQQRKGMVQTASQLQFIHEALIEGIKRGDTAVNENIFESEYDKHGSKIKMGNMSLTQQFSFLKTVKTNEDKTANNKYIVNNRTHLYRFPSHTLEFGMYFEELQNVEPNDVWKGIFQNDSQLAIFILENTKSVAVCPDVGSEETHGEFVIENKSGNYISPTLNVAYLSVKTKGHPELQVNCLTSVLDKSSVKNYIALYKYILDIIQKIEMYRNDLTPIFIFSSDLRYSLIFCILYNIVQRIRLDNEVEIFKVVSKMHRQIRKVIMSQEEYNTLHAVVAEYVKSRNAYANL